MPQREFESEKYMMNNNMNIDVLNSFKNIFMNYDNLSSFKAYYLALCKWVKDNKEVFDANMDDMVRLDILLSLDVDEYVLECNTNGIVLSNEKKRIGEYDYSDTEGFLMVIVDTLWDMVTISADADCQNCYYGDMRYIKINNPKGKIVLECNDCGHAMNLDGTALNEEIINYMPASQTELKSQRNSIKGKNENIHCR